MLNKLFLCLVGLLKICFIKIMHWRRMMFHFKTYVFPSLRIQIGKNAKISIGKGFSARRNCEINATNNAEITIGENVFINSSCIITAHKRITIGSDVEFGPNVLVFDHDHLFHKDGYKAREFISEEIIIGNNVWIGAGTIILRGTYIGDNSIIAAGSLVKGSIGEQLLFLQKRKDEVRELLREKNQ